LHRYEEKIGRIVELLEPDLIHVHDVFHLGLASRYKTRLQNKGKETKIVYDVHEFIPGLPVDPQKRHGYEDLESEYVSNVDALVTVSPGLKSLIKERFGAEATIVLNSPDLDTTVSATSVREVIALPKNQKIVVYVGGIAAHRGAETLIEMLQHLEEDIHLVFIAAQPSSGYMEVLKRLASQLGVSERVHTAPYVTPEAVIPYISFSDVSVIPLSREVQNYEVALPNKLFQSLHAKVPVVVSDNPDMEKFVIETGIGEVFRNNDPVSIATTIRKVLDDPGRYEQALTNKNLIHRTSWKVQVSFLTDVYKELGVSLNE